MTTALVRDPMYQQLNAALKAMARRLEPGARFVSEREVSRRFGVSRATANKALSTLVVEGVLRLRQGVGTFVTGEEMDYDLRALVSFTHKARAAGRRPSTRVLRFVATSAGAAGERVREALGVEAGESLRYVERLRLADGEPLILERRHIRVARCGGLRRSDLRGSLYELWTDRYGLEIAGATETIRAVNLDAADAGTLGAPAGAAGLLVEAVGAIVGGESLWCERTLYRGDAYVFRNSPARVRAAHPAVGTLIDPPADAGA